MSDDNEMTDDAQFDLFYALLGIVSEADKKVLYESWFTGTTDVRALKALGVKYKLLKESEAA